MSKKAFIYFFNFSLFLLLAFAGSAQPPQEKGRFRDSDLVELIKLDTTIHLDIRYATENNFVGQPVYKEARAFLQRPAADALVKINAQLKPLGYGILVFDGYRPWSVTKLFWNITPAKYKKYVAKPSVGSRHNRGCAVDLTLYDLITGKEVEMTGGYDEMTVRSHKNYSGGTNEQRRLRDLLISTMEQNGFKVFYNEWWHFDYKGWRNYALQDIPFSEIDEAD
ncbi:M15 family metallopeptidase [Nonlabens antarcticus]|uniref:M15 family metallopeptidase n=1 Tax=Nonlabens antarcticus TaxID=392714 RepID=UPI001890F5D9|nr:M15 family metallopeptidase [Nonlabens antarcticus]